MRARIGAVAAVSLSLLLAACGGNANGTAQSTADAITRAAYNNDLQGVTGPFDDALKPHVTHASVGVLADKMHALGDYQGLTFVSSDPAKNEFTFRATFSKGTMNVVERLDSDGKVAAYRVVPIAP